MPSESTTTGSADPSSTGAVQPAHQPGQGESGVAEPGHGIAGEVADALSALAELPVEEHPEVYEALHRRLGDTLSGIDHV